MDKLKLHTPNLTDDNTAKIAALFPHCVLEGKIDFDLLKQELSNSIIDGSQERYQLNWVGKREALLTANAPIAKTLRPCREESVNFDTTENLYIEGDNLDALKLLQETYLNKVKMIYIDPPYNTGNDFIYEDDFAENTADYLQRSNQKDESGNRLTANPESNGRFHSDWLSMMYPRLKLARNLLRDDGVIFISIDDNEQANLKRLCDEVFGEQNFVANIVWQSKSGGGHDEKCIVKEAEYMQVFAKNKLSTIFGRRNIENTNYKLEDQYVSVRGRYLLNKLDRMMRGEHYSEALNYPITSPDGNDIWAGNKKQKTSDWNWRWSKTKVEWGIKNDFLVIQKNNQGEWAVYSKQYEKMNHNGEPVERDYPYRSVILSSEFNTTQGGSELLKLFESNLFDYAKPSKFMEKVLNIGATKENDIILDFFSGSATTAHAVMQLNAEDGGKRKFIMVQIPEACDPKSEAFKAGYKTIADIGKERIRRAGQKIKTDNVLTAPDLDIGFRVLKIDSSNMNEVYYSPDALSKDDLHRFVDNIKPDRSDEDLLFQVLLDWGVDLSLPLERKTIADKPVFVVADDAIVACFDRNGGVTEAFITELATLKPLRAVFCDAGFASDSVKINIEQIFKLLSPSTDIKTI